MFARERQGPESHFAEERVSLPWYVVGSRWVGCRRVSCSRRSPGCGVNRRRRCTQSLSSFCLPEVDAFPVFSNALCLRFLAMWCASFPAQLTSGVSARMRDPVPFAESGRTLYASLAACPFRVGRARVRDASIACGVGALRSGDVWAESCGSCLGKWRRKCLQRVIMDCCRKGHESTCGALVQKKVSEQLRFWFGR